MVSIRINGECSSIRGDGLPRISDVIELIKASIDPDHMITAIQLNGRELGDEDWVSSTNRHETAIIEVETGTPESFVAERLLQAASVVNACFLEFRAVRKKFQEGEIQAGNKLLASAVRTLKAFFDWYGSIVDLMPEDRRRASDITPQVRDLSETCKKICQQQLYQSWWALGETLEKELEPKLDRLDDFCRKLGKPA